MNIEIDEGKDLFKDEKQIAVKKNNMTLDIEQKQVSIVTENLIAMAIEKGDIGIVERLVALYDKQKADYAKEQFDIAMSGFQGECPVIEKTKDGIRPNAGGTPSKYAPLSSILSQVKPLLEKYRLSYTFNSENPTADGVKVSCTASHISGHSKASIPIWLPLTTKTSMMSPPMQVTATISFGERKAFCQIFGIITGDDEDIDIHKGDKPKSDNQVVYDKAWERFEKLCLLLAKNFSPGEVENNKKVVFNHETEKLTIKTLQEYIDCYEKKYSGVLKVGGNEK